MILCSSAMRLIQVSDLMLIKEGRKRDESPAKVGENQRQNDTQDDRSRERKVEREVSSPDGEITGQPAERNPGHHQQPEPGDPETDEDQRLTHEKHHHGGHGRQPRTRTPLANDRAY